MSSHNMEYYTLERIEEILNDNEFYGDDDSENDEKEFIYNKEYSNIINILQEYLKNDDKNIKNYSCWQKHTI
ncbi:hypothetical protein [Brachyspira hyodysenteriae]|uniref:hypothetical protein n=1 Tax=Brachyspira hyodysenteriae TaxID=159 RepID=UPI000A924980|nr:hypothetical protein [Brachyspira hyodysenteriae]